MLPNLTNALDFHSKALVLRADRQRLIASNIANADTPGYVGRDLNFKEAMNAALGRSTPSLAAMPSGNAANQQITHPGHMELKPSTLSMADPTLQYTTQSQPAMDGNSVDMDRERASFVDNSVRYEATLRFINGSSKTLMSAIQGQ